MPATLNFPPVALTLTSGWQPFPLGDGGYIIGINVSATGAAGGAYCKTDVSGGYYWNGTSWHQVINVASKGGMIGSIANGVWEIVGAPTNYQKAYMVYGDERVDQAGHYAVWVSSNGGQTSWTKTNVWFTAFQTGYWELYGSDLPNGPKGKFANQKIVADPANANVAYVGMPVGVNMTDTHAASPASVYRTLDGGTTWAVVSGLPVPRNYPGYAGMCIDKSSGTTTLSGQTVTNRIILPCAGVGVYESTNGGSSFTKISSDATPSTTVSYTTTLANCVIVVQINCTGEGQVTGVTNTGTASLTWTRRAGLTRNDTTTSVLFEYYAVAASAGTYNISVQYADGNLSYWTNANVDTATCTAGTVSGKTFTVAGTVTGAFAIGQELTGTGLPSSSAGEYVFGQFGLVNGIYIVSGSGTTWTLNTPVMPVSATTIHGRTRIANQVNVFAVKGCDVSSMPGSAFDAGGPAPGYSPFGAGAATITTVSANCLVFSFGFTNYGPPGVITPDAGYTAMSMTAYPPFWSEISSTALAAGARTPGAAANPVMLITDALKQGAAMTIALNGTPQYATSGPALNTQPVGIYTGQMDNSGTYWCIDGPTKKTPGNIWRYKSGAWECISGSSVATATAGLRFGTPGNGSLGNALAVDPRAGFEGRVTFSGPNGCFRGYQTTSGNAAVASMTWWGSSGGALTTNIGASGVPWLGGYSTTGTGPAAVGDMYIDPVTGKYWQAGGHGVHVINADLHLDETGGFICNCTNESQGIEEMLVQQVLAVPGGKTMAGAEDEMVLICDLPNPPLAKARDDGDSHAWGMDYASNNPAFVWAYITGPNGTGKYSCWSNNYGAVGSWRSPVVMPPNTQLGGCMACASAGADGLSPTNATASVVIIPGRNAVKPIYTLDNGNTWHDTDLPTQSYIGTMEWATTLLAADRVTIGTYYCYAPGTGTYRSTNYGVNWTLVSSFVIGTAAASAGYALLSAPGHAGHLWLCANWNGPAPGTVYYSTDGGSNWTALPGVTAAPGYLGTTMWMTLGKPAPGNAYPTVLVYAKIGGVDGYYRGVCNGAGPSAGFTWTQFGTYLDTPPSQFVGIQPNQLWGDPNIYGRLYVGWPSNGVFMYNL